MKLLVMVGQYLDAKGRIAESQATVGFADLVTGARSNRTSKKSGGSSGKRLTGGLLVKAGFGGGEASLSIPDSESTTTGVAVQTYKVNPLKHGGPSLAEESVKTDAGNGFAFFKEWFPWDSHGSCYFRIGGGYLRYPEGDSYTGVDLGFGQRWVVGNLAFDISWLQLMIHTNQIEKPSEDSGVKNRHPGVRTPAFGLGYAF